MMYHEIKFSCKQITSSEDTVETKKSNFESTNKGVDQCSQYVTQVPQQRPELPTVT